MYDLGEEKGTHYITMEYVPGEDLKRLIRKVGQFSAGKTIFIAKQACEGLAEAHRLGVVHRDLKPQNVMVDEEGNARIMDFGIARSVKGKGITGAGVMIGTPEYMSPEQAEVKEVDQRSDIYSLGVILYEMVTGRVPFEGVTPLGIAMKHKGEMPKDPREINAQIPEDLSRVILRCMEKDKTNRYQSAGEVRAELKRIEQGIPTTEREIPERKPKTVKIGELKLKSLILYGSASILLILLTVVVIFLLTGHQKAIDSIAVLPLENLSGDPEQEYFADGMTEALISRLTQIESLRVRSRTSVMKFKDTLKSVPEIAEELNVDAIVDGSVMRSEEKVQIRVQLIEARTDRNIWSNSYERNVTDVLTMQNEIAQEIARQIKIKLTSQEQKSLEAHHAVNPDAYEAYLKGRYYWNERSVEGILRGIDHFNQAIEIDSTYAKAYAGLADSYIVLGEWLIYPPKDVFPKAKAAALKALEIDDGLAEAHKALASVKQDYDWEWAGAEREYKRAIELNPNYPSAHQWYAEYLSLMGRHDEAIAEIKRAQELDPLSRIICSTGGGLIFFNARNYDRGIEQCKKALDLDSTFIPAHYHLIRNYLQKEMYDKVIAEIEKAKSLAGINSIILFKSAVYYALVGKRSEALQLLKDLEESLDHKYIDPATIAIIYSKLNQKDRAFEWLEKAYQKRSYRLIFLKVNPFYDDLRSDPRFTSLLKKMGLD